MLKNLIIRNYALIEYLDLDFGPGLTIITGETGAGKSIMLGALSLVMGGRADTKVISDGGSKSVVEALFVDVEPELQALFEEKGIDWLTDADGVSEMTIRRELSASGRSKIFVNDTSVTLQTLSMIVPRLIDIHSQRANAKINDASERLRIIDAMAENKPLRAKYTKLYHDYVAVRHRIDEKKSSMAKATENLEFLRFQLDQLEKLKPRRGELKEIERKFEILSDADDIKERLMTLCGILGDSDRGVQSILGEAAALADKVDFSIGQPASKSDAGDETDRTESEKENQITSRLKAVIVEVRDLYETVEDFNSMIDTDPATLSKLSARMNLYYEAVKRFRVGNADELEDLYNNVKAQVESITLGDDSLPSLEREAYALAKKLKETSAKLSETRRKCADKFSRLLRETARPLGLQNINFQVDVRPRKLSATGGDEVEFLCSFNKNGIPKPVSEIASGGEIARMMLSLKSILAGHINLPTIIFDEVDTGVSGEIADKMGDMMHRIAEDMQVIVITHLPQVASKGDDHFKVYKTDGATRTITHVQRLSHEDRIRELAAMISGSEVSEAALSAARALLENRAAHVKNKPESI
ncbi:MAG: DNA repair protein RecN [Muribaculaceae bacterium]|nr:DNA repair protein RecN [Muribaculaceae bacterium]